MLNAYIISTKQTRKPHSLLYYENTVLQLQISQYCQSWFALWWHFISSNKNITFPKDSIWPLIYEQYVSFDVDGAIIGIMPILFKNSFKKINSNKSVCTCNKLSDSSNLNVTCY